MNRFNRLLTRPLIFALIATGMVAAVGEPVLAPAEDAPLPAVMADASAPADQASTGEALDVKVEFEESGSVEISRAERAARLRWLITLPHARNSCCRRPV